MKSSHPWPRRLIWVLVLIAPALTIACGRDGGDAPAATRQGLPPSILLVTLDTTRADAIGPEAAGIATPGFTGVAARGRRFRQAYATAPETLPSHGSMFTGLYPAGHGVHENARALSPSHPVVTERLRQSGYRTAAFVSSFVLARRFGLSRGFEEYDDELERGGSERSAEKTTDRAIAYLQRPPNGPVFLWVHYFDPHAPYAPPEPFRSRFDRSPYLGEVAAMDQQLGRLVEAFERAAGRAAAIVIAGDHGEGLGDHGESQHGNLLYGSTMRVPLVIAGPGVEVGVSDAPVSTRRIYHTILDWAGQPEAGSLRHAREEVVLGEAMKPFLAFGWQPQVMALAGSLKAIDAGSVEVYDLAADPSESRNLGVGRLPAAVRRAIDDYPIPPAQNAGPADALSDDAKRRLASLGYVSAAAAPVVRGDAPRPADMVHLFDLIEEASRLFVEERYREVVPLLERILAEDPRNLDAALRLATAHSSLGNDGAALRAFERAAAIAPESPDVRTYLGLHYARGSDWRKAVPMLEEAVAREPERLAAVEALATLRERQGRIAEALALRQKVHALRQPDVADFLHLGRLAMAARQTTPAIEAFEEARALQGDRFQAHLELGVLYLAARRFAEARDALDRVPSSHPEYPMALFKRAQVSVLLDEPDRRERIARARRAADATTRALIANEELFERVRVP